MDIAHESFEIRKARGLHARARLPSAGRGRHRVRHPHGPRLGPAPHGGARADRGSAAARRAVRRALPPDRRLLHGYEAASQAGPGPGPRPQAAAARRADQRPGPHRPGRDAGPDQAHRHRLRDLGRGGVPPARRDRAGLQRSCWPSTPATSCGPPRSRLHTADARPGRRSGGGRRAARRRPGRHAEFKASGRTANASSSPSKERAPYDVVRDTVADLELPLVRIEQERRRLEDLFRDTAPASVSPTAPASRRHRQGVSNERPTSGAATSPAGNIYDLGYRHYEGKRHGGWFAVWSLFVESLRGVWGFGRPMTAKAAPFILAGLYCLPGLHPAALSLGVLEGSVGKAAARAVHLRQLLWGLRASSSILFLRGPGAGTGLPRPAVSRAAALLHPGPGACQYAFASVAALSTALFVVLIVRWSPCSSATCS